MTTCYDPERLILAPDWHAYRGAGMTAEHAHADRYASLRAVLDAAYAQAAEGKGAARHASDGQAFEDQPIMTIARRRGLGFLLGQADKKTQEAQGMAERGERDAAVRELHGAINYLAAAVLLVGESPEPETPAGFSPESPRRGR